MNCICISTNGQTDFALAGPPDRVLVATMRGICALERAGEGWRIAGRFLQDSHFSAMMAAPGTDVILAGAHTGGLWVSRDGGESWRRRDRGITLGNVYSLGGAVTRGGCALYAGTSPVSLFRSDDLAESWRELPAIARMPGREKWTFPPPPHEAHTKSFHLDPRDPQRMFVAIEQGALLRSDDGGESWREIDSYFDPADQWYRDIHRVVARRTDPDALFMTTGMGLYHSTDCGEHWRHLTSPEFRVGYPDHLTLSPDDKTMFMSGARTDPATWHHLHVAHATVMRSDDHGLSWQPAGAGLPDPSRSNIETMVVAHWPGGYALFVGNTDGEVYCSEDAGAGWTRVGHGMAPVSKGGHYRNLQPALA